MYLDCNIVKEGTPSLNEKCEKIRLPLSDDEKACIKSLYEYMIVSENEEMTKKYGIRPGVGIAAPQVGVNKRMFAMNATDFLDEKHTKYMYAIINPQIIAHTEEMTYLPDGEGCLSVTRNTEGLVTPRYYGIKAKAILFDYKTEKCKNVTMELYGYPAIVFQHEYDHLDGILYTSKMYKVDELPVKAVPLYTVEDNENEDDKEEDN